MNRVVSNGLGCLELSWLKGYLRELPEEVSCF